MMSELAPLKKTPPSQIGNSKTGGTIQTPSKNQKKEELPPGESEPPEVRDKRRQRLLKCLGDNIEHNYLFNAFVESLGVKERYERFIKDWPDLFLSIARGSPVADSKGIVANTGRSEARLRGLPFTDVFISYPKLMGLTKEARLVEYFIFLFDAMVNAVRVANKDIPAGGTPIPACRLNLDEHQTDAIPGTPHKPDITFYHNYMTYDIQSVHAILEAKMDSNPKRTPEDTRGQLADYGYLLNDQQATRTFAPIFYLHGHLLTLHAYYRDKLYIVELGQLCFNTGRWTPELAGRIQSCLMRLWFLLTLESDIFGHFCDVSEESDSFFFSQKVNVESKGDSKIEVLYSASKHVKDVKDVKDGETIARYSYMIGRHVHLFRGTCKGRDAVLKLSWTPVNRLPEGAAYAILNK
ncbi:hypothetical protein BX661DRAFT_203257, partial [Kickxella alabastrina]|uniref:uncharacterized protein n=1 Tax=Kickxella alabastrina TaxID=61397 RepID=UPI00221F62A3